MIATDLTKQQRLDANPKAIQQISFTGNVARDAAMFFITEEEKESLWDFSQRALRVLWISYAILFCVNIISI